MSKELNDQARSWYLRMHSGEVSVAEEQEYARWLAADDQHREAIEGIESQWQELEELSSWAGTEMQLLEAELSPPRSSYRHIVQLFSAMAVAALLVFTFVTYISADNKYELYRFETMKGEQRKIVLEDGSRVHLNSSSSLTVQYTDEAREISLLRGEGLFEVAHERNRPFIVKVRDSKIVAVGTSFNVHYKKNEIAVTVLEGRVAIVPTEQVIKEDVSLAAVEVAGEAAVASVLVDPDQQANVDGKGKLADLKVVDAEKITAWNRGLLILDNTPLREVAAELSRYIVGNVRVAGSVPDYPVTGVIKITDQETMFQLLSEVVPITPVRQSSQLTMLYPSDMNPVMSISR